MNIFLCRFSSGRPLMGVSTPRIMIGRNLIVTHCHPPCRHPLFTLCSLCVHPVFTLSLPCLHPVFTLLLGSIFWVLFWVVYRAIFGLMSRSVFHPAERTTYVLLLFQGFTLGTSWLLASYMNKQFTDLLALDYLPSNVEKRVERTLILNVSN